MQTVKTTVEMIGSDKNAEPLLKQQFERIYIVCIGVVLITHIMHVRYMHKKKS